MSSDAISVQSSLLMWALAAAIVWLASHVMLGWMRQAQEAWEWDFGRWGQVAIGGAVFGTALAVAIPLGLGGEALSFPIGYRPLAALGLWLGGVFVIMLLAFIPVWRAESASAAGAGLLLGLVMSALQVGWMLAVGFRPGVQWNIAFVIAGAVVSAAGTATAMALAFPYGDRARKYKYSWRIASAGLMGLSFLAGYALVLYAADLPVQIGSVYRYELPGAMLSLFGGAVLPVVLLLMAMDLEARRKTRRRQWRDRRRGGMPVASYGNDSVLTSLDEPSRFLMHGPAPGRLPPGYETAPHSEPHSQPHAELQPPSHPSTPAAEGSGGTSR